MHRISVFSNAVTLELLILIALEFVTHLGSVFVAFPTSFASDGVSQIQQNAEPLMAAALLFAGLMTVSLVSLGGYGWGSLNASWPQALRRLALAYGATLVTIAVLLRFIPVTGSGLGLFVMAALISSVGLVVLRVLFRALADDPSLQYRILVMGTGDRARGIEKLLSKKTAAAPRTVVGYMALEGSRVLVDPTKVVNLNGTLCEFVYQQGIKAIVVAADERRMALPINDLLRCRLSGVRIVNLETFYEIEQKKLRLDLVTPGWLVFSEGFNRNLFNTTGERLLDITIALVLLILTLPLMLLATLAIKFEEGWAAPILFTQTRVGEGGKHFRIYKLRSMKVDAEGDGQARWASREDDRVTRVGAVVRKFRLDELPQLINVLKGDMSIVGPRPERPEFVQELTRKIPYYLERHRVRPGITGWAQIKYPYGASTHDALEKLQFDLYYIKHHSLFLYVLILLLTVEVVLFNKGAR